MQILFFINNMINSLLATINYSIHYRDGQLSALEPFFI